MDTEGGFVCLFPGQGAQHPGMGKEMYEHFSVAREIFETADESLGWSLSRLCFEGPAEELTSTKNAQPAIFTVAIAALEMLRGEGFYPSATAGHSVGEYAALVCAGALPFETALDLVVKRGAFMQEAATQNPGTMAAVLGLEDEEVLSICAESGAEAANFNCPGQVVVSGSVEAVGKAGELARARGGKCLALSVSGAFHSPLMSSAGERLSAALDSVTFQRACVPVYCNVDGRATVEPEALKRALSRQVTSSVLWKDSLLNMQREIEPVAFVELGSSKVLGGMIRRTLSNAQILSIYDKKSFDSTIKRLREGIT